MASVSLAPATVDITGVRAGDRNQFNLTLNQAGHGVDLTGMVITAQARVTAGAADSLDAVVETVDAEAGKVLVRWPGEDVRFWLGTKTTQKGVWDLQLQEGENDPWTVISGSFSAEMDVTRVNISD